MLVGKFASGVRRWLTVITDYTIQTLRVRGGTWYMYFAAVRMALIVREGGLGIGSGLVCGCCAFRGVLVVLWCG